VTLRVFRTELPSTQAEAVRRARDGAPEGTRVVANRQTAGRGRGEHVWASPEGNLYLSVLLRFPTTHRPILSLAVGVRLRAALAERYGVATLLKWPNDLLLAEAAPARKLAGILIDVVPSPTLGRVAVVGVGVNVAADPDAYPDDLRDRVVGLSELVPETPDLGVVEGLAVSAVRDAVDELATPSGTAALLEDCRAALYGLGRSATVDAELTGVIRGVGDEGELWLDTPTGAVAVRAGSLVLEGM
jgi:BirA family biotin operon repressor/biotin-[acetyl-CoA-carboxylase] ligase